MIVTYEIELDSPDYFVTIEADDSCSEEKLLEIAINEMTKNTSIWKMRKV